MQIFIRKIIFLQLLVPSTPGTEYESDSTTYSDNMKTKLIP